MWIASKIGFFSIVQKKHNEYHVRARRKKDLLNLAKLAKSSELSPFLFAKKDIFHTPDGDYAWRVILREASIHWLFVRLSTTINYDNFKDKVKKQKDQDNKLYAYSSFWADMVRVQKREGK